MFIHRIIPIAMNIIHRIISYHIIYVIYIPSLTGRSRDARSNPEDEREEGHPALYEHKVCHIAYPTSYTCITGI